MCDRHTAFFYSCVSTGNDLVSLPLRYNAVLNFWMNRFEGPNCNIDINECVRQTDDCSPNSACINTLGGFKCQCYWGYSGSARHLGCRPASCKPIECFPRRNRRSVIKGSYKLIFFFKKLCESHQASDLKLKPPNSG